MTWQLTVSGHLADVNEEDELRARCRAFVDELAADPRHNLTHARFGGGGMRKTLVAALAMAILALGVPARASVQPVWTPQPGCHLQGKAEFRQYLVAIATANRALLYEACDPDPWGPR